MQSRYYDPELGRFINADAYASTGQGILGNNMFAYCLNNPVSLTDYNGELAVSSLVISSLVSGLVSFVTTFATTGSVWEGLKAAALDSIFGFLVGKEIKWANIVHDISPYGMLAYG